MTHTRLDDAHFRIRAYTGSSCTGPAHGWYEVVRNRVFISRSRIPHPASRIPHGDAVFGRPYGVMILR
jgi:hypothetical protein